MRVLLALIIMMATACTAWADTPLVYVDPAYLGAAAVQSRIEHQLAPDDHISVQVIVARDSSPFRGTTVISYSSVTDKFTVVADDGWLDQPTAEGLLARALSLSTDPVDKIVMFIRQVHQWQATHPRPSPPSPSSSPVNWAPWLWAGTGLAIVIVSAGWLFRRIRHHQNYIAGLAARADEQQAKWDRGEISSIFEYKGDM